MKQTFCARAGCGLARSAHGFMPQACANFIPSKPKKHTPKLATVRA